MRASRSSTKQSGGDDGLIQAFVRMSRIVLKPRSPPATLFHYTTAEGLLGILRDGAVHASDLSHANDPSEAHYANEILSQVATRVLEEEGDGERRAMLRAIHELSHALSLATGTYGFCMSEVPDQLGQWRAYAAMGLGYCVGFDTAAMRSVGADTAPSPYFHLEKVTYDASEQQRRIRRLAAAVLDAAESSRPATRRAVASSLFMVGGQVSLRTFKNPAFAEEREWRAVAMGPVAQDYTNVSFRTNGGHIVPYEPLNLWGGGQRRTGPLPIVSITTGPRSEPLRASDSIRGLLKKYGYPSTILVSHSGVPLR